MGDMRIQPRERRGPWFPSTKEGGGKQIIHISPLGGGDWSPRVEIAEIGSQKSRKCKWVRVGLKWAGKEGQKTYSQFRAPSNLRFVQRTIKI